MSNFRCNICGLEFGKERGLQTHFARMHGPNAVGKTRKKRKYTKRKNATSNLLSPAGKDRKDSLSLSIPCNLAGRDFNVEVTMTINGTAIYPV